MLGELNPLVEFRLSNSSSVNLNSIHPPFESSNGFCCDARDRRHVYNLLTTLRLTTILRREDILNKCSRDFFIGNTLYLASFGFPKPEKFRVLSLS